MLDNYTPSQQRAKGTFASGRNILLTGNPGAGKTAVLEDICEESRANGKRVLTTGSTGMAAANLEGGRTIHSALGWFPRGTNFNIEVCARAMAECDLLILDEISMLGKDILDHFMKCYKSLPDKPQLIFSGDFFQLPPVRDDYPFEHAQWNDLALTPCFLKEVVRQQDPVFKAMLERAMLGDPSCIDYFNTATSPKKIDGAICLCTLNKYADEINKMQFDALPGTAKVYGALGDTAQANFRNARIQCYLSLKKGMRVMALRNTADYQNGSLGTVLDMDDDTIVVRFDAGKTVAIGRVDYYLESTRNRTDTVCIEQFPIIGGYAITIHKSQGQTFDAVNIKAPNCWEPGQLYVALSRCRTIKGMHLMDPITAESLKTDARVIQYYMNLQNENDFDAA